MRNRSNFGRISIATAVIISALFLLLNGSATAVQPTVSKISPELQAQLDRRADEESINVVVFMQERANLNGIQASNRAIRIRKVITTLQETSDTSQAQVKNMLEARRFEGRVSYVQSYWVFNGLVVTAEKSVIEALAAMPQVASIQENQTYQAPAPQGTGSTPEANISLVSAPDLWSLGFTGTGIVVATMDSGVSGTHSDLTAQYRGGANSWFDPYNEHPNSPTDLLGHGTASMGVIVGRDAGGTAVGIAPDAQWISVKIFNDQGVATTESIHAGFQWLLDPDNDPGTADTPHIVSNSWTLGIPGCDLEFQPDLQALRAANILPLFAAGNLGGTPSTSPSPSNYPEAFAVGATDNLDVLYSGSSQGTSACGEAETIFPELVAPGVDVYSTDLFNLYTTNSGTSMAVPHVAGALALLLDAYPSLTVAEQEAALINGAVDLGVAGADNLFGNGRLNILASYQWLAGGSPTATPTNLPPPTSTSLPPTATSTNLPATATSLPTATATSLPTATPPPPAPAIEYYLSLRNSGSYAVGALPDVGDEDIIGFDGVDFVMIFDGSDVGLTSARVDALHVVDADTFLLSFDAELTIDPLGLVDDSDVVQFDATSTGDVTAGSFTLYFDGSDVGLTNNGEDVDALALLDDGRLLISTLGNARVSGATGRDEDLMAFTPTGLGEATNGSWAVYFDGSDMALADSGGEDVDGTAVTSSGALDFSTQGNFDVTAVSGNDEDIFNVILSSSGENNTSGTYDTQLSFDGSVQGIGGNDINAISIFADAAPAPTATPLPPTATSLPPTATSLPPTATSLPPTATSLPPTATSLPPTTTSLPPTATSLPPTATSLPPTATSLPPTATSLPPTATSLPPTATPLPPTATPSPTPPSSGSDMHIGDMDGSSSNSGSRWNAVATVTVHDDGGGVVSGATVFGTWAYGSRSQSASCVTDGTGQCDVSFNNIPGFLMSVTFTVDDVTGTLTYDALVNHDPEGDSDGTVLTVAKP